MRQILGQELPKRRKNLYGGRQRANPHRFPQRNGKGGTSMVVRYKDFSFEVPAPVLLAIIALVKLKVS